MLMLLNIRLSKMANQQSSDEAECKSLPIGNCEMLRVKHQCSANGSPTPDKHLIAVHRRRRSMLLIRCSALTAAQVVIYRPTKTQEKKNNKHSPPDPHQGLIKDLSFLILCA